VSDIYCNKIHLTPMATQIIGPGAFMVPNPSLPGWGPPQPRTPVESQRSLPALVPHPSVQAAAYWEAQFFALKAKYDDLLTRYKIEAPPARGKQSHHGRGRGTPALHPPKRESTEPSRTPRDTALQLADAPIAPPEQLLPPNHPQPSTRELNIAARRSYRLKVRALVQEIKGSTPSPPSRCSFVEKQGDLLSAPEQFKAHAVAADMKCSKGLAAAVVEKFGRPSDVPTDLKPGDIVSHPFTEDDVVLFLVTKMKSHHKPRRHFAKFLADVHTSLDEFAKFIIQREIKEIAIPYLCCGLDRLNWLYIKNYLRQALSQHEVRVVVYHLPRPPSRGQLSPPRGGHQSPQPRTQPSPSVASLREHFEGRNNEDFPELPHPLSDLSKGRQKALAARMKPNQAPMNVSPDDVIKTCSFNKVSDNQRQANNYVPFPNTPPTPPF
jgi:hypothetical protein